MRIPGTPFSDTPGMEPKTFMKLLHMNVNNARLTDKAFRKFVSNSLETVEYERPEIDIYFNHTNLAMAKKVYRRLAKLYPAISFGLSVLENKGIIWTRKNLLSLTNYNTVAGSAYTIYHTIQGEERQKHGNSHSRARATKSVRRKANLRRSR